MIHYNIIIIPIVLILSSQFQTAFSCALKHNHDRQGITLDDPLYLADSVKEFLSQCQNQTEIKFISDLPDPDEFSSCPHPAAKPSRNFKKVEIFFLQQAQKKLRAQGIYVKSIFRGLFSWLLFLIPTGMTIYLVLVNQFNFRTLPTIGPFLKQIIDKDKTTGLIYSQLQFMKFNIRPRSHWSFKGQKDKYTWLQYFKWDHNFNWKSVVTFQKFKFLDIKHISRHLDEDEYHSRKMNLLQQKWDFLVLDRRPETPKEEVSTDQETF